MRAKMFAILLMLASTLADAQGPRRFDFKSRTDQFQLLLNGSNASVDGKPADLSTFKELMPMLLKPLGEECPSLKGPPDVTVFEDGRLPGRRIYLHQKAVTDGKKCLYVSGEGLMYFPIHRNWFIGNTQDSLTFGPTVLFQRDGEKVFEIKRKGKSWVQEDPEFHPDWDFLQRLENSLKSYKIKMHMNLELGKGKPTFEIVTNGRTYKFYQVTTKIWALQKAPQPWLITSNDWSQWYDMNVSQLEDHRAPQLRFILDRSKPKEERLQALDKLDTGWSRALHEMYFRLLQESTEDQAIQKIALERLRSKPTVETAGVLVEYLKSSPYEDLKKMASQTLRIQNPKGPLFEPKDSFDKKQQAVEEWSRWWQRIRPAGA